MYGSCCNERLGKIELLYYCSLTHMHSIISKQLKVQHTHNNEKKLFCTRQSDNVVSVTLIYELYFVLVDTPYPDDGVPSSGEETIQRRVKLERIHPIPIVLLNLISNDIRHLEHGEENELRLQHQSHHFYTSSFI